ncbi:hypothetical protein PUN28_000953 [Cardiocondyla obscurior]|uniref:Uncharacterized protein n=1 Tax=Cardiocondyla obscurior TaxID=286306 RepID=A0AAW2H205_9HYME
MSISNKKKNIFAGNLTEYRAPFVTLAVLQFLRYLTISRDFKESTKLHSHFPLENFSRQLKVNSLKTRKLISKGRSPSAISNFSPRIPTSNLRVSVLRHAKRSHVTCAQEKKKKKPSVCFTESFSVLSRPSLNHETSLTFSFFFFLFKERSIAIFLKLYFH